MSTIVILSLIWLNFHMIENVFHVSTLSINWRLCWVQHQWCFHNASLTTDNSPFERERPIGLHLPTFDCNTSCKLFGTSFLLPAPGGSWWADAAFFCHKHALLLLTNAKECMLLDSHWTRGARPFRIWWAFHLFAIIGSCMLTCHTLVTGMVVLATR